MPKRTLPEPRSWIRGDPAEFGTDARIQWCTGADAHERGLIASAKHQHETSRKVRRQMRQRGKSSRTLADDLGITVDQLRRVLRGEAHLLIADSYLMAEHLKRNESGRDATSG